MEWIKSKTAILGFCCLALVGFEAYGILSMRRAMDDRMGSIENDLRSMHQDTETKITALQSDLSLVTQRVGDTDDELEEAQQQAKQLKQQNSQMAQRLRREIATKADSKAVLQFHEDTTNQLDAVQKDANSKIDGINGQVHGVRLDLDATREDLANSKRDIHSLIARNSTELAELRRKGERDYLEFDLRKAKQYKRVGDVLVQLRKTDIKRQKYEVAINADDSSIIKKDRTANEPITFFVGRDHVRYEFVVNFVDKDRVRGYISAPKDKLVASDAPSFRAK
jgi:chromosome segregation ATPase